MSKKIREHQQIEWPPRWGGSITEKYCQPNLDPRFHKVAVLTNVCALMPDEEWLTIDVSHRDSDSSITGNIHVKDKAILIPLSEELQKQIGQTVEALGEIELPF